MRGHRSCSRTDRRSFARRAESAFAIPVAGATAQGVVDRQRPLTGEWLGYQLPAAMTDATPANLNLSLEKSEKKENGYEFRFRWKWNVENAMERVPEIVTAEVPNFIDLRVIEMAVDKTDQEHRDVLGDVH